MSMETSTAQITYHPSSPSPLAKTETRMEKQNEAVSSSIPPNPNQEKSEKPEMASQEETTPRCRPDGGDDAEAEVESDASVKPEDFEFCILAPGGLFPAGEDAAGVDMCVAGEVFSGGKLVPFRLSSATSADALLLFRSDSLDSSTTTTASTSDFSSSSDSGSASFSSSSSSSALSRSASLESASSSDSTAVGLSHLPPKNGPACARSLTTSSSWFYAHPSPSPPRRTGGSAVSAARRRSTGSAPPPAAAWGVIRLGVVGAPELVYPPPPHGGAEARKAARSRGGVSRSARLDQPRPAGDKEQPLAAEKKKKKKKKLVFGLLGAGLACSCSADDVAPRQAARGEAEAEEEGRRDEESQKGEVDSGHGGAVLGSSSGRSISQLPNARSKNSVER